MNALFSSDGQGGKCGGAWLRWGLIRLDDPALERYIRFKKRSEIGVSGMWWLDEKGQPNDYYPEMRGERPSACCDEEDF